MLVIAHLIIIEFYQGLSKLDPHPYAFRLLLANHLTIQVVSKPSRHVEVDVPNIVTCCLCRFSTQETDGGGYSDQETLQVRNIRGLRFFAVAVEINRLTD